MNLKIWLIEKHMNITEFAEIIGCHRHHIYNILSGSHKPSKRLAKSIEMATKGKVKADEILSLYRPKKAPKQLDLIKDAPKKKEKNQ